MRRWLRYGRGNVRKLRLFRIVEFSTDTDDVLLCPGCWRNLTELTPVAEFVQYGLPGERDEQWTLYVCPECMGQYAFHGSWPSPNDMEV